MAARQLLPLLLLLLLLTRTTHGDDDNDAPEPPIVLWYAPFLSGGGYCSEAHSYVTAISTALRIANDAKQQHDSTDDSVVVEAPHQSLDADASAVNAPAADSVRGAPFTLFATQHGDALNAAFIRDIPDDMRSLLEEHWIEPREFHWRLLGQDVAVAICHSEPGAWHPAHYATSQCPPDGTKFAVGRTMFETDRVPTGWIDRMNAMDEIWVPTRFQERVFVDGGVRADAIHVVPEPVDVHFFDPTSVATAYDLASDVPGVTAATTVFLSIFKWEERKAWRVLLRAYFEAFDAQQDDVLLVLLTNAYHSDAERAADFVDKIEHFARETLGRSLAELPRVHVLPPQLPQTSMPSLFRAASAFVLPSRGEGWGRPHVEAMAMALPVIATFWSGTTEYMTDANSYPLRIDGLVEVPDGAFRGHKWAEPSVTHLKELLVHVRDHPEEATAKGQQARHDMVAKYSPDVVGAIILGHIDRILKHVAQHDVARDDRDEL